MGQVTDREHLMWIHARLAERHRENELYDYMHRLRAIITNIPPEQVTPNDGRGQNSLQQLQKVLNDADNQTEPTTTLEASQDICKGSQAPQDAPTITTPTAPTVEA
jgi:hypothetical protein